MWIIIIYVSNFCSGSSMNDSYRIDISKSGFSEFLNIFFVGFYLLNKFHVADYNISFLRQYLLVNILLMLLSASWLP